MDLREGRWLGRLHRCGPAKHGGLVCLWATGPTRCAPLWHSAARSETFARLGRAPPQAAPPHFPQTVADREDLTKNPGPHSPDIPRPPPRTPLYGQQWALSRHRDRCEQSPEPADSRTPRRNAVARTRVIARAASGPRQRSATTWGTWAPEITRRSRPSKILRSSPKKSPSRPRRPAIPHPSLGTGAPRSTCRSIASLARGPTRGDHDDDAHTLAICSRLTTCSELGVHVISPPRSGIERASRGRLATLARGCGASRAGSPAITAHHTRLLAAASSRSSRARRCEPASQRPLREGHAARVHATAPRRAPARPGAVAGQPARVFRSPGPREP